MSEKLLINKTYIDGIKNKTPRDLFRLVYVKTKQSIWNQYRHLFSLDKCSRISSIVTVKIFNMLNIPMLVENHNNINFMVSIYINGDVFKYDVFNIQDEETVLKLSNGSISHREQFKINDLNTLTAVGRRGRGLSHYTSVIAKEALLESNYRMHTAIVDGNAPIISIDWDDVMYHLMQKNIEFIDKEFGIKNIHQHIPDYYYLYRTYPRIAEMLWNHPENYITGELVDGALDFYNKLVHHYGEDRIQIVTSSMENVIPLKNNMIKERFGINCKVIHSIFGKYKKHEFTDKTLLIDDHTMNVLEHEQTNGYRGIVFNHMNLDYIKRDCKFFGLTHVTTFDELFNKIIQILK